MAVGHYGVTPLCGLYFLASLSLDESFAIGKIAYGVAAGFWGPTWFFFRRWEGQHRKEIVSAGFFSTRIYAEDAVH